MSKKTPVVVKTVLLKFESDLLRRVTAASEAREMDRMSWIIESIREKLDRIESGRDGGWGPLADLPKADRERAVKLTECLRIAPDEKGFRTAIEANFDWLMESQLRANKVKTKK